MTSRMGGERTLPEVGFCADVWTEPLGQVLMTIFFLFYRFAFQVGSLGEVFPSYDHPRKTQNLLSRVYVCWPCTNVSIWLDGWPPPSLANETIRLENLRMLLKSSTSVIWSPRAYTQRVCVKLYSSYTHMAIICTMVLCDLKNKKISER